jgi:hypothetical protein
MNRLGGRQRIGFNMHLGVVFDFKSHGIGGNMNTKLSPTADLETKNNVIILVRHSLIIKPKRHLAKASYIGHYGVYLDIETKRLIITHRFLHRFSHELMLCPTKLKGGRYVKRTDGIFQQATPVRDPQHCQ